MNGIIFVCIIFVIIIGSSIVGGILKKNIFQELYFALNEKNYSVFFDKVDRVLAKAFLPIYMRENMRLTAYINQGNQVQVSEQFNRMIKLKLDQYQVNALLVRAYNYYLLSFDQKKCQKVLMKMKELNLLQVQKYQRHYDIIFNHSTLYIKELENDILKHRGKMKGYLEYLLAKSFQAQNNQYKYQKHIKEAANLYKIGADELDYEIQVI